MIEAELTNLNNRIRAAHLLTRDKARRVAINIASRSC
jgi:hypothetical protein